MPWYRCPNCGSRYTAATLAEPRCDAAMDEHSEDASAPMRPRTLLWVFRPIAGTTALNAECIDAMTEDERDAVHRATAPVGGCGECACCEGGYAAAREGGS